jgi:methionyl-tRNA formyltransferase
MLAQRAVPIEPSATSATLHDELARLGAGMLLDVIAALESGSAAPRAQAAEGVRYAHKLTKGEAMIDWSADAPAIARQVRGCNPWPTAQTSLAGLLVKIWQADASATSNETTAKHASGPPTPGSVLGLHDGRLLVACGTGVLAIEKLQVAGKRTVKAAEFAHGHASAQGHAIDGLKFG